jgi:hypothetical protein
LRNALPSSNKFRTSKPKSQPNTRNIADAIRKFKKIFRYFYIYSVLWLLKAICLRHLSEAAHETEAPEKH